MGRLVRIADRPERAGVAAGGERAILGGCLAGDGAAGIENAGNDGGVDVGNIAFQHPAAVHRRNAGDAHRVFDADIIAFENARLRALDVAAHIPAVIGIFLSGRPVAGVARIFLLRAPFRDVFQHAVGGHRPLHNILIGLAILLRHLKPELIGQLKNLANRRQISTLRHVIPPTKNCYASPLSLATILRK